MLSLGIVGKFIISNLEAAKGRSKINVLQFSNLIRQNS